MKIKFFVLIFLSLLLLGCSSVKTIYSTLPIPIAAVRSPVTVELGNVFEPINSKISNFDKCKLLEISDQDIEGNEFEKYCKEYENESNGSVGFDNFEDLCEKEKLVFVAISGGGARATSLATHTMALLEKRYNAINHVSLEKGKLTPLIDKIDVISTVSGGSIYAYQLARVKTLLDKIGEQTNKNSEKVNNKHEIFQKIASLPFKSYDHGIYSSIWYTSPANAFLGPLMTLLSNIDYLDILSGGLNVFSYHNELFVIDHEYHEENQCSDTTPSCIATEKIKSQLKKSEQPFYERYNPVHIKVSEISETPRIFFNATALETGLPFVFTQRYVNLPGSKEFFGTVRHDLRENKSSAALQTATTLEEINSTPKKMPLAYAAMASAAFPMGLKPLKLAKYSYQPVSQEIYKTSDSIHVSDGGIYDNSGLASLKDLVHHLKVKRGCGIKRLLLLSINADADEYDMFYPHRIASEASFFQKSPISLNLPLRTGALGVKALNLIHFVNKQRAEQIAIDTIREIDTKSGLDFKFFPVSLRQLSPYEKYRISDPSNLFKKLQDIGTNYVIRKEDHDTLAYAADLLIGSEQEDAAWQFKKCDTDDFIKKTKLREAFVYALNSKKSCEKVLTVIEPAP